MDTKALRNYLKNQKNIKVDDNGNLAIATKYTKAYELLKELWFSVSLSDETYDEIGCDLANDISALFDHANDDFEEDN